MSFREYLAEIKKLAHFSFESYLKDPNLVKLLDVSKDLDNLESDPGLFADWMRDLIQNLCLYHYESELQNSNSNYWVRPALTLILVEGLPGM